MNASVKLGIFGAALLAIFGVAAILGKVAGPAPNVADAEVMAPVGEGVVSVAEGYRFVPTGTTLSEHGGAFTFRIEASDGDVVTRFVPTHERRLHLIVANRELTRFHHLHPALAADGTWSVDVPALPAGSYRAVADFRVADGPALALGVDLSVAGSYRPEDPAEPSHTATTDGYVVHLDAKHGDGGEVEVAMTVRKGGRVVDVQPYLGASGHLVALRSGDLHYAHVHPLEDADGSVRFAATLPSAGRYRLFFDFKHGDAVHTAAFTFDQAHVTGAPSMGH
jgi:hypothetical protein